MPLLDSGERSEPLVRALADAYRRSQHGRTGKSRREFHIRFDKLVHEGAKATVAQEKRGRAILERLRSVGIIRWDRTPLQRDQIKTIYIAPAAEQDFFNAIGETPPSDMRGDAVNTLAKHLGALDNHPLAVEWKAAVQEAIDDIRDGRAADGLPNNTRLHDEILQAAAAVLNNNRKPVLVRRLSAEKLGDSKLLGRRRSTVERFLGQFLSPDSATLEAWNVADTPPLVTLRGPLGLELEDGTIVSELAPRSPYTIREEVLERACRTFSSATRCISIENTTTFREMVALNAEDLLVHTSYPSSAVVRLLRLLPATMRLQHWGDTDPWGYDILRVLREKTGRKIEPWRMNFRTGPGPQLSKRERAILERLIADPLVADIRPELLAMRNVGNKGYFEQESLPVVE